MRRSRSQYLRRHTCFHSREGAPAHHGCRLLPQKEKCMTAAASSDTLDSRQLLRVLMAVRKGDFSVRMPSDYTGTAGKIADTLNEIIDLNERTTQAFEHISTVVGTEGR